MRPLFVIGKRLLVLPAVALALTACGPSAVSGSGTGRATAVPTHRSVAKPSAPVPSRSATHRPSRPVHAGFFEADDHTYGIGMPVIVRFDRMVTDRATFARTVQVKVNGNAVAGAWAWERSPSPGWTLEAHYRTEGFWPPHSTITVAAPLRGQRAGTGLAYDDSLTLSFAVGAAHVSTVYGAGANPHMVVKSDGKVVKTLNASLGDADNPTYRGTKIVEEFDRVENMEGTPVPWSVRLTNSGEFVHAAPWNSAIGRANLSHGCTNLSTADAQWFYRFSQLGDVVLYPDAPGQVVSPVDGFGDWNVPWAQWRAQSTGNALLA